MRYHSNVVQTDMGVGGYSGHFRLRSQKKSILNFVKLVRVLLPVRNKYPFPWPLKLKALLTVIAKYGFPNREYALMYQALLRC